MFIIQSSVLRPSLLADRQGYFSIYVLDTDKRFIKEITHIPVICVVQYYHVKCGIHSWLAACPKQRGRTICI